MAVPKWTEERTKQLTEFVGDETPVSQATVAEAAEQLDTSTRSVSSKLRKMGYDVENVSAARASKYTPEQEEALRDLVTDNSGEFTYEDIAKAFENGAFSAKEIQGKILSMEMTSHVKPAEKKEVVKKYTDEEQEQFLALIGEGAFVEDIAEALGKTVASVRGKALSLQRAGMIETMPKQKNITERVDALTNLGDISEMSVAEIAEAIEKTERGVRTMLTRRGLVCSDYDGKSRKEKAAS